VSVHPIRDDGKTWVRKRRRREPAAVTVRYDPSVIRPELRLIQGGAGTVTPLPGDEPPPPAA
jgi:hypothetical protein